MLLLHPVRLLKWVHADTLSRSLPKPLLLCRHSHHTESDLGFWTKKTYFLQPDHIHEKVTQPSGQPQQITVISQDSFY